jgi:hypothetical protein
MGGSGKRHLTPLKMLDRNWVYTAITRAEIELHLVGPEQLRLSELVPPFDGKPISPTCLGDRGLISFGVSLGHLASLGFCFNVCEEPLQLLSQTPNFQQLSSAST